MIPETILLVDDEPDLREALREGLQEAGYLVEATDRAETALEMLSRKRYPVIITDFQLPGGPSGLDLVAAVKVRDPKVLCIVITGHASLPMAIEALKRGAYDFVQKPFQLAELEASLNRALDHARVLRELEDYQHELEAKILARVKEFHTFHQEVLRLNELLCQSFSATDEHAVMEPFLAHLRGRCDAAGMALLCPRGTQWIPLSSTGERPWRETQEMPPPASLKQNREWDGWYPDGYLIPLRAPDRLLACLVLGFEARSTFQLDDPEFMLWVQQASASLHALRRVQSASSEAMYALGRS